MRSATRNFASVYDQGFVRVAACVPTVTIADPRANAAAVVELFGECASEGVGVAVFPELVLSGYSIEDLLLQEALLDAVEEGLAELVAASADLPTVLVVGAPLRHANRLLNCAVVVHRGALLGVAPKSYLPTYREFYERRHFAPGDDRRGATITLLGQTVPLGPDLLFRAEDVPNLTFHVEVCEDMWVPVPPSAEAALAGATVLLNLSGSPITVGRADQRRLLARSASMRCLAAYVYAAGGPGESSTDLSWDGQTMVYELGQLLAETDRFPVNPRRAVADVDLLRLRQERMRQGTFDDNRRTHDARTGFRTVAFTLEPDRGDLGLRRTVHRFPFVPEDPERLALDCYEAYNIQVTALTQRLEAIGNPKVVIGVSGGLDSTHALMLAGKAMDRLGRPRSDILAFTMPGFATTSTTKGNATRLSHALGATFAEIDIRPAAELMLREMDHPFAEGHPVYDITFENVQAGLRTDYLFRLANQRGGIVLGTGDLSELALGWCTYGVGDQMSHYAVNAGIPKTLIQHLIRWAITNGEFDTDTNAVLSAILAQEISPELVPVQDGEGPQSTEAKIGPYALQDFTLFHVLRYGFPPSRIAFLALHAWSDPDVGPWPPGFDGVRTSYDLPTIRHWLQVFCSRFFGFSQFKRSAIPNGPKVVAGGALSPRGEWRAPSDGNANVWLAEIERNVPA